MHQVNLEYLARVVFDERRRAVPRHARRDRLAHDDDQRPRRARLGRRRHRGRGGDARPADVDADPARGRLQARRRAARGRDRDRPRADRHARCCASTASSASSSSSTAPGIANLPLADRATIGNMSPEFGSTCAIFPIDAETLRYLEFSGRAPEQVELVEAYAQGAGPVARRGRARSRPTPRRSSSTSARSCRRSPGPKRPQDRVSLTESKASFRIALEDLVPTAGTRAPTSRSRSPSRPPTRRPPTATRRTTGSAERARGRRHRRRAGRRPRLGERCR